MDPRSKGIVVGKARRLLSLINSGASDQEVKSVLSSLTDDFSGDPDKDLSSGPPSPGQQAANKSSGPGDAAGSPDKQHQQNLPSGGPPPFPIKSQATAGMLALNRFKKKQGARG